MDFHQEKQEEIQPRPDLFEVGRQTPGDPFGQVLLLPFLE
jgi:hypothetical protein